jgi:hypothetical protein
MGKSISGELNKALKEFGMGEVVCAPTASGGMEVMGVTEAGVAAEGTVDDTEVDVSTEGTGAGESPRKKIPIKVTPGAEPGVFTFEPDFPAMPFPRMSSRHIKGFVLDYCDGKIWTQMDVEPHLIPAVFLPIALGGISPPWELLPENLNEPDPPEGLRPELAFVREKFSEEMPVKPDAIEPDPGTLRDLRAGIEYDMGSEEAVSAYEDSCRKDNGIRQAEYRVLLDAWRDRKRAHGESEKLREKRAKAAHEKAIRKWEKEQASYLAQKAAYEAGRDKADADFKAINAHWLRDMGGFYGHIKDATSGRCINGYPIFFAMGFIHKDDWPLVVDGIGVEMKRREEYLGDDK